MPKVLIVDDSKSIRMNMKRIFEKNGYEVVDEAKNGAEGYEKYKKHRPDLVIMDIIMPDISGVTAVEKIISDFPNAKIIIVSSITQESMIIDALKKGAKNYLVKPVKEENLIEIAEKILEGEMKERETEGNSPFDFRVKNDTFIMKLKSNFQNSNFSELSDVVNKMMEVSSIKILLDIGELDFLNNHFDNEIFKLITRIYKKGIELEVFTKDEKLLKKIKEKDMKSIIYK